MSALPRLGVASAVSSHPAIQRWNNRTRQRRAPATTLTASSPAAFKTASTARRQRLPPFAVKEDAAADTCTPFRSPHAAQQRRRCTVLGLCTACFADMLGRVLCQRAGVEACLCPALRQSPLATGRDPSASRRRNKQSVLMPRLCMVSNCRRICARQSKKGGVRAKRSRRRAAGRAGYPGVRKGLAQPTLGSRSACASDTNLEDLNPMEQTRGLNRARRPQVPAQLDQSGLALRVRGPARQHPPFQRSPHRRGRSREPGPCLSTNGASCKTRAEGGTLGGAPEWKHKLGLRCNATLADSDECRPPVHGSHAGAVPGDRTDSMGEAAGATSCGSCTRVNFNVGLSQGDWDVSRWVQNLVNVQPDVSRQDLGLMGCRALHTAPRTIGVKVSPHFR